VSIAEWFIVWPGDANVRTSCGSWSLLPHSEIALSAFVSLCIHELQAFVVQ